MSDGAPVKSWSTRQLFAAGILSAGVAVGSLAWPFLRHGLRRTAPYVAASPRLVERQISTIPTSKKDAPLSVIDLGSGDGSVLAEFAKAFPKWKNFTGVDNNFVLIASSALRYRRDDRIKFRVGDLFATNLAPYDVILVCLVPSMLPQVEQMLEKTAKSGALVICSRFALPTWKPTNVLDGGPIDGVFVYTKQDRT